MPAIVSAKNLTKKYKDFTAVDSITFEIEEGECFGFLGPNGAGKTSTIKMIHCVSPADSGELCVLGMPAHIENREIKKNTGVIPQEIALDTDLTLYENLLIYSQFFDIKKNEAVKKIDDILDLTGLSAKKNSKIDELSTGMKRRLMVGRALLNNPKLIIADEPTTGLDPQARHLIWQRLRSLKKKGITLILTTQYMEEAQQLCDRIVIMHQGKIFKAGSPANLIKEEIGREVAELRINPEQDEKILSCLTGIKIQHERIGDTLYIYSDIDHAVMRKLVELDLPKLINRPATLEDVFLKLTGRGLIE